ncbi:MAG TPA: TIM barrel protein [Gemmatimonadales bacterium]|nr:TIM barrel protein [Gemmatimonadales bacterium]
MNRRQAIAVIAATGAAAGPTAELTLRPPARPAARLKQSVCRWPYDKIPLEDLCRAAKEIGLQSVELLGPEEWPVAIRHGLTCAMATGPTTIPVGLNRPDQHDRILAESERLLPLVARAGLPNMIVFSGNRAGLADSEGLENCVVGLKRMVPLAERWGVTICMELLNSKIDHHDYQCDHTPWGAELARRVGSPRFKLLYDIYHMQIMEGDVIRTIRDNFAFIGHFHTGGVPGRHELDETQELQYRAIMNAIADLGYTGFVGQEFIPSQGRDPIASLRHGFTVCDI